MTRRRQPQSELKDGPQFSDGPDLTDARELGVHRHAGARDDEGRISLFLLVIFLAFVLLAGFTTDLGRVLHANARASDLAAKAARAGAQELDPASLRGGTNQLNPAAARAAALDYIDQWRASTPAGGQVSADADATTGQVTVTVTWPVRFWLLAALRPSATVTQARTANPSTGP